jgi:hypothetical protein
MKTISTAEYLMTNIQGFQFTERVDGITIGRTYAAVAASVSNRGFATVTLCISPEKTTTKAVITSNLPSAEPTPFKNPQRRNQHKQPCQTNHSGNESFKSFIAFIVHGFRVIVSVVLGFAPETGKPAKAGGFLQEAAERCVRNREFI